VSLQKILQKRSFPYLLLGLVCLAVYTPGIATISPIDRDESRFAQASKQMLETRDFVNISFQDQPRHKKPIGIYWLQAASTALLGDGSHIWTYRVPSVLGALGAVWLTYLFGVPILLSGFTREAARISAEDLLKAKRAALIGALLLAVSALLVVEAHLATTDAVLLACIVAGQGALGFLFLRGRPDSVIDPRTSRLPPKAAAMIFWIAQGVGILVKGPVLPTISVLTILVLLVTDRRGGWLKTLRPLMGILLLFAIIAPWGIAISLETKGAFFKGHLLQDALSKVTAGMESHGAYPGTYLLLAFVTFFPGSLFLVPAFAHSTKMWRVPAIRFFLAWIVPGWLAFELIPTKLPHYVLPFYPAIALTMGFVLVNETLIIEKSKEGTSWMTPSRLRGFIPFLPWLLVAAFSIAAVLVAPIQFGQGLQWPSVAVALLVVTKGVLVVWLLRKRRTLEVIVILIAFTGLGYALFFGSILPGLRDLWAGQKIVRMVSAFCPSPQVASKGQSSSAGCTSERIAVTGYREPSVVFLLGTQTPLLTNVADAARHVLQNPSHLAVVEEHQLIQFKKGLGNKTVRELDKVQAFNYTKGQRMTLYLFGQ
jgi:4-amino-4-deoxy-L-arabinose transferase-like glycosyltransferase